MELAGILGEKELAPLLSAWAGQKADHAVSVAEVRSMLLTRGDRNRLEGWWKKAEPVLTTVTAKSDFAADTTSGSQLKGEPKELSRDDGASAGKRSAAGSAHVVRFDAPGDDWYLTGVRVFGSRYGQPGTAADQVKVGLCDKDFKLIATFAFPYASFEPGEPKWVELPVKPTRVPERFTVSVGFNPTATRGVFVHHDREASGDSLLGLPGHEGKAFEKGDWLVRAVVRQGAK
jgi:hypothetical protein